MIRMTKNIKEANLITHNGKFHADEVMATAILSKIYDDAIVCRVDKLTEGVAEGVIVYDIDDGKFDHHLRNNRKLRSNGMPYSTCGLIWNAFGKEIVKNTSNPNLIWENVDKRLIKGIDAADNKENRYYSKIDIKAMNISEAITMFNPTWNEKEDSDDAFLKAVNFAIQIFDNVLRNIIDKTKAKPLIEEAIIKSSNHIMVLEQFVPWHQHLFDSHNMKSQTIWFVIYPSKRGGYNWEVVTIDINSKKPRKDVPNNWKGKKENELKKITGISSAKFCHPNGFVGGASTLEGAIEMVNLIIK